MTESFTVGIGTSVVEGDLTVPGDAAGVVVFAHGSGSSRHSPRNQAVARTLQDHRFATLLLDMLSGEEDRAEAAGGRLRFDIGVLRDRLLRALDDLGHHSAVAGLPVGVVRGRTPVRGARCAGAGCRLGRRLVRPAPRVRRRPSVHPLRNHGRVVAAARG
jgi:putative phosphoribosyl transferase